MKRSGEWICRDGDGWRVKVPCQGGHKYFSFVEYGNSQKALKAARKFHESMCRQLGEDREYEKKHGEKPKRETLNLRNRSGHHGISMVVEPRLNSKEPRIIYIATYYKNGRQYNNRFSNVKYGTKEDALKAALEWAKKMRGHK